jgi:hypothetical protein
MQVSRVLPSDAGSVRWRVEAVGGALVKRIEEEKGLVARLPPPGGVFGQLEYLSPPERARKNLDRHPNYILAAYMASDT